MRFSLGVLATTTFSLLQFGLDAAAFATPHSDLVVRQSRSSPLLGVFPGQGLLPTLDTILNLNATNGTFLPIQNIQGDILVGMKKQKELFFFFKINNPTAFKATLLTYSPKITSVATLLSPASSQPLAFVNIAFSSAGLQTLGITDNLGDTNFANGMWADAGGLGDDTSSWENVFKSTDNHGVFLIGSDSDVYINSYVNEIQTLFGTSITERTRISGAARPGAEAGHEHFGYLDGISNPAVMGFDPTVLPGQALVPSGIILTGRLGDLALRPTWTLDGSFLAFRKLKQNVPEFKKYLLDNPVQNTAGNLTAQQGAELLGARMVGRWRSGAPIDINPEFDDPVLGADPQRNNNFDYAHLGSSLISDQSKCPFSAHIRKTNPRADQLNLNVINHAIRAGIPYGPETTSSELNSGTSTQERGLAFVEYQSNIGNGFRFQQVNWANTANFPPLKSNTPGIEPIIGQGNPRTAGGLDPRDPAKTYTLPLFVVPKGGEYFFSPSISAITQKICSS